MDINVLFVAVKAVSAFYQRLWHCDGFTMISFYSKGLHAEAAKACNPTTDAPDTDCNNSKAIMKEIFPNPNSPLLVAGGDDSWCGRLTDVRDPGKRVFSRSVIYLFIYCLTWWQWNIHTHTLIYTLLNNYPKSVRHLEVWWPTSDRLMGKPRWQ